MNGKKISLRAKLFKPRSHDYRAVTIKTETNGGGIKTLIIALLIAVQLGFLIYLHVSFAFAFKWWVVISFILSVICCVFVLSSEKNGLSKAVWIIFLLLCFTFSVPIFILSDERIFFRRAKKKYVKVFKRSKDCLKGDFLNLNASDCVVADCEYLYNAGKFIAYNDSSVNYFPSGYLFFEEVINRLKQAEKFIFIEYYIVSEGVLFNRIYDVLSEKVNKGVDVRIIFDDMGSHRGLTRKVKKKLKLLGIKIMPFNRLVPVFAVGLNYRDHRKIIIIDGKVAFTGGCNLADEYINEKRMHGYWKDNGVIVRGRAVDAFTLIFLRQWEYLTGVKEDYSLFFNNFEKLESKYTVVPYADGLEYNLPIGKGVYENVIIGAKEKVYIMTPYFIPDDTFFNLLVNKALSGVEVKIFIPQIPDKNYVYCVSRNNAEKLVGYGVKVFTVNNTFLHSKVVMSENAVSTGSINVDLRSFYQQFENAVYTDSQEFIKQVEKDFIDLESKSTLLDKDNLKSNNFFYKIFAGLLQIFAPLM